MKRFINSLCVCGLLCSVACSNPAEETSEMVATKPEVQTQEVAEVSTQIPKVQTKVETEVSTQTVSVEPKKQLKQTPKNTAQQPLKTFYPGEVILHLKQWDKKLNTLKTNFTQTTQYDGVQISASSGTLFYQKNGNLLRLDTFTPDGTLDQSALTDKKTILILDGNGQPITTLSWEDWQQGQPNQALFDFGNYTALLDKHNVTLIHPYVLQLTPKEGDSYSLFLTLSKEDYFPQTIKIISDLLVTQADLTHTSKNQPLDNTTFGGFNK